MKVRERKQLTEPQAEMAVSLAARDRDTWHVCSGCLRERRVEGAVMVPHRAWVPVLQEMVACPGTDLPPAWVTAAQ